MGKGDKKSKKGKLAKGSYGNARRKNVIKARLKRHAVAKPAVAVDAAEAKPKVKRVAKKKAETAE